MKKRIIKLISVSVIGVMAVSLAACTDNSKKDSSTGESGKTDYKIGLVVKTATNAHFQDIAYGAEEAAEEYGATLTTLNTTSESDVNGQIQMCEDLISQGNQALVLTANDSKGLSTAVSEAHDANVKFVALDTTIDNVWGSKYLDYVPTYIGEDHVNSGYTVAKQVAEKIGGKGSVVVIRGVDAASSSNDRTKGIKKALAEYPGIKIVAEQSGNYDTETAQTKMSDILQSHKDIKAVLCCNDLMAIGCVNALEEQGIKVGGSDGVVVSGLDGNIVALQSIKEGKMYATLYDWTMLQGYWGVYDAIQLLKGDPVPENFVTPVTLITSSNVAQYIPHFQTLSKWTMGSKINS